MKRYKPNPAQDAFEWPEPEQLPQPVVFDCPRQDVDIVDKCGQPLTLDAEGHLWWAEFGRAMQEHCIGEVAQMKDAELMGELAKVAKDWKIFANIHEAKGNETVSL